VPRHETPRVVTLPFSPEDLPGRPLELAYNTYRAGDPFDALAGTTFWLTPYLDQVDYAATLPRMRHLEVVHAQSAGTEHLGRHLMPSTTLCSARGVHDAATAEFAVALILASLRQIPRFVAAQAESRWDNDNDGVSLADRRVLIIGHGSIGRALGRRLSAFECVVVGLSRSGGDDSLPLSELPAQLILADVIVLLTPLTPDTQHLVDDDFLARMKDGALLVNMARGGIVDTEALLRAVGGGRLHAALDVTDPEPLPRGHPLWTARNVLITPHAGGGTSAMGPRIRSLVERQLKAYAAGDPLENVVDH